ncbi:hypothetical protein CEXT_32541 [Caerostris extrusa]|uniref:Uncharacterized protein n=1 Tax=Caerostris extrusa TaxID=172846 RepID=A0AAV4V9X8_CAEEX|nr:hypothetical protein CEXT_32541 [Caerostris extrusa]
MDWIGMEIWNGLGWIGNMDYGLPMDIKTKKKISENYGFSRRLPNTTCIGTPDIGFYWDTAPDIGFYCGTAPDIGFYWDTAPDIGFYCGTAPDIGFYWDTAPDIGFYWDTAPDVRFYCAYDRGII